MMKTVVIAATVTLAGGMAMAGEGYKALSKSAGGKNSAVPSVEEKNLRVPHNPGHFSPDMQMFSYNSPAFYTFESEARKALNACVSNFQAAGLNVIASRILPTGSAYSYSLEYIDGGNIAAQIPAFSIVRYETPGSYWPERDAQEAMKQSMIWFRNAGLNVTSGEVLERDMQHYGFSIAYLIRKQTPDHGPHHAHHVTAKYLSRRAFSFESQARNAAASTAAELTAAGIRVLDSYLVNTTDNKYCFEIAYLARAGQPDVQDMSFKNYQSREEFSFERQAREAMRARVDMFNNAGMRVVDAYLIPGSANNYRFALQYMVRNMPGNHWQGQLDIQVYQENRTYRFESEARRAMAERQQVISQAGFSVVGGSVIPAGNDYTFTIEYIVKTQQHHPQYGWSGNQRDQKRPQKK